MVPFADMFNHKASVVHLDGGYEVAETGAAVPAAAGTQQTNERKVGRTRPNDADEGSAGAAEQGSKRRRVRDGCCAGAARPWKRAMPRYASRTAARQAPAAGRSRATRLRSLADEETATQQAQTDAADDEAAFYACFPHSNLRLEIAICDEVEEASGSGGDTEVLHIIAAQAVAAKAEVHNTYGEHSSDALLSKYGFALAGNVFHAVLFSFEEVKQAAAHCLGPAAGERAGLLLALLRDASGAAAEASEGSAEDHTSADGEHPHENGAEGHEVGSAGEECFR